jgi:cadmium resistance transport/sequestration family protein
VSQVFATIATAAGVFAATNIDDIIVLTVLFLACRATGKPRPWQIWTGQYAGIAALIAASAAAAAGLTIVPDKWVGLLGLIPLALGIRGLITTLRTHNSGEDHDTVVATNALAVAGVTIANGADNISVYTPLFRTIGLNSTLVTIGVFAVLVAGWCLAGSLLASHPKVIAVVERYGHWIVPIVFMAIGGVIILESGVLGHLAELL